MAFLCKQGERVQGDHGVPEVQGWHGATVLFDKKPIVHVPAAYPVAGREGGGVLDHTANTLQSLNTYVGHTPP